MIFHIFFALLVSFESAVASQDLCAAVSEKVQEGDLLFLDIDSIVFEKVAEATPTWTSHVGVAVYDNEWFVAESTLLRSKKTPLCRFLERTQEGRFSVRRLKNPLSTVQMNHLKDYLNSRMDVLYHTGFDYDSSSRLFCSKLVYDAFLSIGIEVGVIKTFRDLLNENPNGSTTFWKWWFFGTIPWERRTVTPKDQLADSDFFTVLSSEK